ncbi:hypothetical protein [Methylobacterium sp. 391_Methyba4]|uniref:hypothetical protein n=1 Tax=Methylobacterium sp. 391_Methyba4 TaxID=3038924 RepID=UPI00241C24C3|nr:hypothetical protein [Methylobacterium sp. 391_Methyba4]WFS10466.1 hypothetical protein P9K36_14800 [Methylobacterium sp. 391_Methyba4]
MISDAAQVAAVYTSGGLVAFVIAAGIFRQPLARAIDRWKGANLGKDRSIDLSGTAQVEAQKNAPPPEAERLPVPAPEPGAPLPALPPPSPVYAPIEADLRRRIEQAVPGPLDVQMAWAVRIAVAAQVEANHEQTYRLIFGSQIHALKQLNTLGPLTVRQAREIYNNTALRNFPGTFKDEEFPAWGEYLMNRGLVTLEPGEPTENTKAFLTPLGKDFLLFMVGRGLTEYKWG